MATSVIPDLIDALVAQAAAALDVEVFDGFGVSGEVGDCLMVGVDDPNDADGWAQSADTSQTWAGLGHQSRDQEGDVWCAARGWNGQGDQKAARDAAYAIVAAVEDMCRATPTLGVLTSGWVSVSTTERLTQNQTDAGAHAIVAFQVHFKGRI